MNNIEAIVIEMLEAGIDVERIAQLLDLTKEQVLDIEDYACENRDCDEDYDGQPDEYTEWQDYMGGDDWDHGQYDYE
jgi:hypothetical protein